MPAWKMAAKNRKITEELIFHSDKGIQYANKNFANMLDSFKTVTRSRSCRGNCWDNAVAENFFKFLKIVLIYGNKLIAKEQMELEIFDLSDSELAKQYVEIWYNKKRRHSALNYKTIEEFNKLTNYKNVA